MSSPFPFPGDCKFWGRLWGPWLKLPSPNFGSGTSVIANAGLRFFGGFLIYSRKDFMEWVGSIKAGTFVSYPGCRKDHEDSTYWRSQSFTPASVTAHPKATENLAAYAMKPKLRLKCLPKTCVPWACSIRIRINTIAPVRLQSLIAGQFLDPDYVEKTWPNFTPVGSPANVEDIRSGSAFLVSEAAKNISLSDLIIDGGWPPLALSPYGWK